MEPDKTSHFLRKVEDLCEKARDKNTAAGQKAYMRDQFPFFGIKTPARRAIQRQLFQKELLPPRGDLTLLVRALWEKEERESQYIAQELAKKLSRSPQPDDHALYKYMITHKSWWDTVDFIAIQLVGPYFKAFPEKRDEVTEGWMNSGNIWLQRSVLLFQLKYKKELDTAFLARTIVRLLGSREFFINKAIGWVLREYSKTNGDWVGRFAQATPLEPLSKREALRLLSA
jgi:3-methyladenine DNA glycosylase AlkD